SLSWNLEASTAGRELPNNKQLRIILNNDINNILTSCSGKNITAQEYKRAVEALLGGKPVVLAQNVGMPDPVIYRSKVATSWDKHNVETSLLTWPKADPREIKEGAEVQADAIRRLISLRTDPLALTIEVCRQHGVFIVASYR